MVSLWYMTGGEEDSVRRKGRVDQQLFLLQPRVGQIRHYNRNSLNSEGLRRAEAPSGRMPSSTTAQQMHNLDRSDLGISASISIWFSPYKTSGASDRVTAAYQGWKLEGLRLGK